MRAQAGISTAQSSWLAQALGSELSLTCLFLLLIAAVGLALCLPALGTLVRHRCRQRLRLLGSNQGTATIEFTLVFPIALFLVLTLAQTTLVMGGNLFVHYAAFSAVRSAIVQIPQSTLYEPANAIADEGDSYKRAMIRRSAVFALVPVAGKLPQGSAPGTQFQNALNEWYAASGIASPRWVQTLPIDRLNYADANTWIRLLETTTDASGDVALLPIETAYRFGPKDPVTVEVIHELNLSVPWASAIFSDGVHEQGRSMGRYATVRAHYTLSNEGISSRLPPTPSLPRDP